MSILQQTEQDVLYADEDSGYPNVIYPTDILRNIAINNNTQSLAPDIAYFYLQNTLGLSEETMWKITLEAGTILGMTPRNLEKKVSLLRRTMNLSDEDVRVILGKQPAVLHYSADRNVAPTILFLVRALDLGKSELRSMIIDCPSILGYSLENLGKKVSFFRSLGYSDNDETNGMDFVRELLVGTPKLLLAAVDTGLVPRMKFLLNEIQFSVEELRTLYQKNPRLLLYSLDANLREKIVFFFILQLHMEPKHVRKILLAFPQVMDYNLENHIRPIAEYFTAELDYSSTELGRIVTKFPRIFSYSLFKIKHVIGFLRYELELNPRQAKRIIFQAPQVVGLDTDGNLKGKIDFLKNRLDLTASEIGLVLSKMPTLMQLGIESNLQPKLEYLEQTLLDEAEADRVLLKEIVLKQPTLLGYSLQSRIQPRMEKILHAGISPDKITVCISMGEKKFQEWLLSSKTRKMAALQATEQNSINVCKILDNLNLTKEEITQLTKMDEWGAPDLKSWIGYLEERLGTGADLKSTLQTHSMLLDSSYCHEVSRRLEELHSGSLPIMDNIDTLYWPDDRFDSWIIQSTSEISYLQRVLHLNETERDIIVSEMPSLEGTQCDHVLQQQLKFFIEECGDSTEDAKALLLEQPYLLYLSIRQVVSPRMEKIRQAGVTDPRMVSDLITKTGEDFLEWWRPIDNNLTLAAMRNQSSETFECLKESLQFTEREIDSFVEGGRIIEWENATLSGAKVNHLLTLGSKDEVKNAILSQPNLLSYSLEKLQSMIKPLSVKMSTSATLSFYEESASMLKATLGLSQEDADFVLATTSYLCLRDPTEFLAPKLDFLLSAFGGSKPDVVSCVLTSPEMLDCSLEDWIKPRMIFLVDSGLDPFQIIEVISLSQSEINGRAEVKECLNLKGGELDCLLPVQDWLGNRRLRRSAEKNVKYLTSQMSSVNDVIKILSEKPRLLSQSLSKTIQPRMEMLLDHGCPSTDIGKVTGFTKAKAEAYCSKYHSFNLIGLSSKQMDIVSASIGSISSKRLCENVDYLLHHVFKSSKKKMKSVILKDPTLLRQSLEETIKPRAEALQYLESIGLLEYHPSEIATFFTQSESCFTEELIPQLNNWYPSTVSEEDGSSEKDGLNEIDSLVVALKDLPSTSAFAYSDDNANREIARVVHWR